MTDCPVPPLAPMVRAALFGLVLALVPALATPAGAAAQAAQVPTLDAVDSLIAAGEYEDARANLERWWSARESFDVPGSDRARALLLRARLRTDLAAAESDYLAIVLGYPTSTHASEALLRLGQGLLAAGQPARAAGYLRRLAADYPGRPQRPLGMLWLARAENAAQRPAAACAAAREGLIDARSEPDLAAMLQLELATSCRMDDSAPAPDRQTAEAAAAPAPAASGPYAIQTGAFRYREGADDLMERLRAAGQEPRMVLVPGSTLLRIRVGRFASADAAAELLRTIRSAGFDAVVVSDADEERSP